MNLIPTMSPWRLHLFSYTGFIAFLLVANFLTRNKFVSSYFARIDSNIIFRARVFAQKCLAVESTKNVTYDGYLYSVVRVNCYFRRLKLV